LDEVLSSIRLLTPTLRARTGIAQQTDQLGRGRCVWGEDSAVADNDAPDQKDREEALAARHRIVISARQQETFAVSEATASTRDDGNLIFDAHQVLLLCLGAATTIELGKRSQSLSPGAAGDNEPCVWLLAKGAIRYLQASPAEGPDLRNLYQCLMRLARWRATE
jgi:hypothetical protein